MEGRNLLNRLLSIADLPGDDDDARLRKRMGVAAGYVTIVAPLGLPWGASSPLIGWVIALILSVWSAGNLLVLARSKRFERYVIALIAVGPVSVLLATEPAFLAGRPNPAAAPTAGPDRPGRSPVRA
jgi:hypothetical protein